MEPYQQLSEGIALLRYRYPRSASISGAQILAWNFHQIVVAHREPILQDAKSTRPRLYARLA